MDLGNTPKQQRFEFKYFLNLLLPLTLIGFNSGMSIADEIGRVPVSYSSSNVSATETQPRTVTVKGVGQIEVTADIATLNLSVEDTHLTSLDAKSSVDSKVNKLISGLNQLGIISEDINAGLIRTSPQFEYLANSKRQITGYKAYRNISVRISPIDLLNEVMDLALSLQINRIQSIELSVSNADEHQQRALKKATSNATSQAKWLAASFNAQLGPVRHIDTLSRGHQIKALPNNIEAIQMHSRSNEMGQGQYLFEKVTFAAELQVEFDLIPIMNPND